MTSLLQASLRLVAAACAAALLMGSLCLPVPAAGAAARRLGPPNTWVPTGSMRAARSGQTATLLRDGKVLVAGGLADGRPLASAELYDPATRAFSATGRMPVAVTGATATLLGDGKVLVAGGLAGGRPVATAELYSPSTGTWAATGSMHAARAGDTATLLPGGQVLVAGGRCNGHGFLNCSPGDYGKSLSSAERYNPATGRWSRTGSMGTGRAYQSATLLRDGKVLVAGGQAYCDDGICVDTRSAELYDPATGTWAATGPMHAAREQHSATLLTDGEVLVAGGINVSGASGFSTDRQAELYDPATGTWRRTAPMNTAHVDATATLLPGGWVLVAGGHTSAAEIYEPRRGVWALPAAMSVQRTHQTATLLPGGQVLVAGGRGPDGKPLATAEEFLAGAGPLVSIRLASVSLGGQQVGTIGGARTYRVTNEGSADLVSSGVSLAGRDPGDFRAATDCAGAPLAPGRACTVSVRFIPQFTGLRTAVAALSDNAPRAPQVVALKGYGGGPDTWVPAGSMASARDQFTATLLPGGKVLVAGGEGPGQDLPPLAGAELYNPATRSFSRTGSLHTPRSDAAAVLLRDGQVLVAGGYGRSGALASAELYSPATGRWRFTTPMHAGGYGLTATLLPDGKVLVAGLGFGHSAEVYDPARRTWTRTGPMTAPQFFGTATLLRDGTVLAVGGGSRAAELYNPATNRWTAAGALKITQVEPTATLLPDGEVLVAGGSTAGVAGRSLTAAELYNPAAGSWSLARHMLAVGRSGATATLLPDGTVLEAGGSRNRFSGHGLSSSEIFLRGAFDPAAAMTQPRVNAAAALLPDGDVLVAGGDTRGSPARTAEIYTPVLMSMRPGRGPAGTRVAVSGSNFYAHETVKVIWYGTGNSGASKIIGRAGTSASGTFTTTVTIPAAKSGRHLVIASGSRSSGAGVAQTTFTVTG